MGEYEPWLIALAPAKGAVCIDVGANVGSWTRWLAQRFEHVHAVEPNPACLPLLRKDLPSNVTVHAVAAWDEERILTFKRYACADHFSAYNEGTLLGQLGVVGPVLENIELAAVPLDALSISGKVDFIKCDTEGGEFQCLLGAERLISENRPVLLIEIHAAENGRRVSALLSEWGYRYREIEHPLHGPNSPYRPEHFWIFTQG